MLSARCAKFGLRSVGIWTTNFQSSTSSTTAAKVSKTSTQFTQSRNVQKYLRSNKSQVRFMSTNRPHGVYVPTDANSEYQSFEFTEENWAKCVEVLAKYPAQYKNSGLAPILDIAQRQCGGWLPLAAMNKVATVVDVSPMDVYEVATFYTMFNLAPIGKHFVQLCGTTPCHAMRAPEIMSALKQRLGVENGGTTADGRFTLLEVECLGACVNAPMMQIDDDYYEDLTPESAIKVIDALAAGRKPEFGPQNGKRKYSEPYGGKTTLTGTPTGPFAPYLEKLDAEAASSSKA